MDHPRQLLSDHKLETICSGRPYAPVINGLKSLAASQDIELTYVPGNHDMAFDPAGIDTTKQFLRDFFKGMNVLCEETAPLGTFKNGAIAAEHGNRYCLFNAPDLASNSGASFVPLGYFISRLDAYKVCRSGSPCSVFDTFIKFMEEFIKGNDNFVEDVFLATAQDCAPGNTTIEVAGLPGYGDPIPVGDVASRFKEIAARWGQIPGTKNVDAATAAQGDQFGLFEAAKTVYFQDNPSSRVVIFGHTHTADMQREFENPENPNYICDPDTTPCRTIYANSGTWIDSSKYGCTYVETEEEGNRLHVRVKSYPENNVVKDWRGFVVL